MTNVTKLRGEEGSNKTIGKDINFILSDYIPFQLVVAQIAMHGVIRPEVHPDVSAKTSLSKGDSRILVLIATGMAISPSEITNTLGIDRAVVTRHLAKLEKQMLISSIKDETDFRRKKFHLTKLGENISATIISIMNDLGRYLDKSITKQEKKTLLAILEKLNNSCAIYPA